MAFPFGTRLGPYEVTAPAGAGGMGEVYRARDTRLERTVAIKVLPSSMADSPDRRARFEREARAISSLNHPHICTLYDVGRQDGLDYLVMEYVEGQTLAERLEKGPLPLEQALRYGGEIAAALDKAHRAGIVHRDLKPGNVMITKTGVKLLDFGLAKLRVEGGSGTLSALMTAEKPLTGEGTLLGTLPYMSPEQVEGKEADARSDIWALGTVLYEMVTAKRAFEGKSQASLIAAILDKQPEAIVKVQPLAPPALDQLVKACLEKDRDERWQNAADVVTAVGWVAAAGDQGDAVPRRRGRQAWLAWALAGSLAVAVVLIATLGRRSAEPGGVLVTSLLPPEGWSFAGGDFALSPDGRLLAFMARRMGSESMLWVRALDGSQERPIAGTNGACCPFWAPDSRSLGFFADRNLKRVALSGGAPDTLCRAWEPMGGSWGQENTIVFAPGPGQPIHAVPASGGPCRPVTRLDPARRDAFHATPAFLADGRRFLFAVATGDSAPFMESIHLASLDGREPKRLVTATANASYASGHLLFWRDQVLRAQPLDAAGEEVAGEAIQIATDVIARPQTGAWFSASQTGLLAYGAGAAAVDRSQLQWFDRSGRQVGSLGDADFHYWPRLSHDGRRVAVDKSNPLQQGDIWIYDVEGSGTIRLTSGVEDETHPVWSPDDSSILYFNLKGGMWADLFRKPADRVAAAEPVLVSPARKIPTDWSSDGRLVTFSSFEGPEAGWDLWLLSLSDGKASPFLATRFNEREGQFSPDGHWIAYVSDESGREEIYVQAFPGPGPRKKVSSAGGAMPKWRRDGTEIFYAGRDGRLAAVPIRRTGGLEAGAPVTLFATRMKMAPGWRHYDVTADGQRFLMNVMVGPEAGRPITLVVNWPALLER